MRVMVILVFALLGLVGACLWVARQHGRQSRAAQTLAAGRAALERQDWKVAVDQLRRYLVHNPQDAAVMRQYADANLAIRPPEPEHVLKALRALRKLTELQPQDQAVHRQLVQLCMDLGDHDEAEEFSRRWQSAGGGAEATRQLAATLHRQKKLDEARETLLALLASEPQDVAASAQLADVLIDAGDRSGARAAVEEAVQASPASAEALVNRAFYRRVLERDEHAVEDLERAESLPDAAPIVLLKLADEWRQWARPERARAVLERGAAAVTAPPATDADAQTVQLLRFVITSRVLRNLGDGPACVKLADDTLQAIAPWQRLTYLPFAVELYLAGQAPDAAEKTIAQYAELVAQVPAEESGSALNRLGLMRAALALAREKTFEAIDLLEGVLVTDSRNLEVRRALWQAYGRSEQNTRKLTHLETYVSLQPEDADAALELARSYRGLEWAKAAHFARLAEQIGGSPQATLLRLEAVISMAAESADAGKLGSARAELDEIAARRPGLSEVCILQARIAALEGRTADAESTLRTALQGPAARPDIAVTLAGLYVRDGRQTEAVQFLQESAQRFPESPAPRLALARLLVDSGQRYQALHELQRARADLPQDLRSRTELLQYPEMQADPDVARQLVEEIKAVEGDNGLCWRLEQARLELRRDDWPAECAGNPAGAAPPQAQAAGGAATCAERVQGIDALLAVCIERRPSWPAPRIELGRLCERAGQADRAEQIYRRLVEAQPGNVAALSPLLGLLVRQGRYKDADEFLRRLPEHTAGLEQFRIQVAWENGDYAAAIHELRKRIKTAPKDAAAHVLLGRLLYEDNSKARDEAMALLDEAGRLDPDLASRAAVAAWIWRQEGRIEQADAVINEQIARRDNYETGALRAAHFEATNRQSDAETEYRRLATLDDAGPRGFTELGRFLHAQGRGDEAVASWRQGLKRWPQDPALNRMLIETLLRSSDGAQREEAQALLEEQLARTPDDADYLYLKAELVHAGNTVESRAAARDLLERACRAEPRHIPACHLLARVIWEQGETREAVERVLLARGINPRHPDLILLQAEFENRLGRPELARRLVDIVLRQDPHHAGGRWLQQQLDMQDMVARGDVEALILRVREQHGAGPQERVVMAHLLASTGNARLLKEARILCEHAVQDAPELVAAYVVLGRVTYHLGDQVTSERAYRRALELRPSDQEALNDLAWLLATKLGQPIEALGLASTGLSYYPDAPELLHTRGVDYRHLGDLSAAAADLRRCAESSQAPPATAASALLELAEIHIRQGQTQQAREALRALRTITSGVALGESQQARLDTLNQQLKG
jgi:tetratricopeptide (TPR) repeat protein